MEGTARKLFLYGNRTGHHIENGCCDGLPNHLISENRRVVSIIVLSFVIWFKVSLNCVLFQQGHDIFVC
jgi:hypothetical protein